MGAGQIYAAQEDGTPLVKIGCTRESVPYRLQLLAYQYKTSFTLLGSVSIANHSMYRIERLVHTFLAAQRIQGEWFYLRLNQHMLTTLVEQACRDLARQDLEQAQRCVRRNVQLGMHHPRRALTARQREVLEVSLDYLAGRKDDERVEREPAAVDLVEA